MNIRLATLADKEDWDRFVDTQNGGFRYYFDWKYVYETQNEIPIQLLIENNSGQIISIFPVKKTNKAVYPSLSARAPLYKNDLTFPESQDLTSKYLHYLDEHHTKGCSFFRIEDFKTGGKSLTGSLTGGEINPVLINSGFQSRYGLEPGLPCLHILGLEQPFHEKIWKGLWTNNLRWILRKAEKKGITIVDDTEMKYLDEYVRLLKLNFKRHGSNPPSEKQIKTEFEVFRDKSRLFVAFFNKRPVVIAACHYTPTTCYLFQIGSESKNTGNATTLIYRAIIEDACDAGYKFCHLGYTDRISLANFKDHFKGQKIPAMVYEKCYSRLGTALELTPKLIMNIINDKKYLWHNRHLIRDKIFH